MQLSSCPTPSPETARSSSTSRAAAINFADTHATRNDYLAEQQLPLIPGGEIAGRTADGRRVAAILASGGYAEKVAVPETLARAGPRRASPTTRPPRCLLQGLTAHALVHRCARLAAGRDRGRPGGGRRDGHASRSSSPSAPAPG